MLEILNSVVSQGKYDPSWTDLEYTSRGGRDYLGVETLSETILADLLPGINNQTRRARYYSFWAWVLRDFINDLAATHTQAGFYQWLHRREDALLLAYLAHGCGSNAAGIEQASKVWLDGEAPSYPIDWPSLLSVKGGGYELYYRGSLQEMNIVSQSEDGSNDSLTSNLGLVLADAYATSVAPTDYVRQYLDATHLRKIDIEDFAQHGCLCEVRYHEEERRRLVEAFFRFDSPDALAIKRLASLCYFLDIIAQSKGQPLDEAAFRAVLYFWSFGAHHAYSPDGNLLTPARRWRIFQLRQYYIFAIETFWSLFLNKIQRETWSSGDYFSWLFGELDFAAIADEFGLNFPSTEISQLSVRSLYGTLRDALTPSILESGTRALQTHLNEQSLTFRIRSDRSGLNANQRAGGALLLLALTYWRCQTWSSGAGWIYASDRYSMGRLPIESYLRDVERAFEEEWTVDRLLGWFHHSYLWIQHRRVVLEKLVSRGQDTSLFDVVDEAPPDAGYQGNVDDACFRGLGIDYPKTNAPRFPSALSILSDLAVIEPIPGNGYRLCSDGSILLERFRQYSVPYETGVDSDEVTEQS